MRNALLVVTSLVAVSLSGCKGDPNTPEYWEKAFSGAKSKKQRVALVEDLRNRKVTPPFLPVLHKRLAEDKAPEVKEAVARLLGEVKDPSSVDALLNAVDMAASESNERAMNKEVVIALGAIGDARAAGTLLKCLKLKDSYTVIAAIEALGALKAAEAAEQLLEKASDETTEPFVTKKAIIALGEIGDPKAVPLLVKMMFKERNRVSFYVESSFALYQFGQPAADAVLPILTGQDKAIVKWAEENGILEPALHAKAAQVLGDLHDLRAEKSLLERLKYNNEALDIKLFVRMRMADALGRLRSQAGAKALAEMLDEEEPTARNEYIRALTRVGGREGVAALTKAIANGSWDAREAAVKGLAMLGDDRELPALEKLTKDEEALFTAECKEDPDQGACKDVAGSVKKHLEVIAGAQKRIEAAKECKADAACWVKKLDDADPGVRERAGFEVGRSGKGELVGELTKRLTEKNLDTRLAIIQGTDWLVHDAPSAGAAAALPELEKQIADEKGKTDFVRVNEDLRRLAVKLARAGKK